MADETVKVRVLVLVGPSGDWYAPSTYGDTYGHKEHDELTSRQASSDAAYWLTAELPIPKRPDPAEVAAGVEDVK